MSKQAEGDGMNDYLESYLVSLKNDKDTDQPGELCTDNDDTGTRALAPHITQEVDSGIGSASYESKSDESSSSPSTGDSDQGCGRKNQGVGDTKTSVEETATGYSSKLCLEPTSPVLRTYIDESLVCATVPVVPETEDNLYEYIKYLDEQTRNFEREWFEREQCLHGALANHTFHEQQVKNDVLPHSPSADRHVPVNERLPIYRRRRRDGPECFHDDDEWFGQHDWNRNVNILRAPFADARPVQQMQGPVPFENLVVFGQQQQGGRLLRQG